MANEQVTSEDSKSAAKEAADRALEAYRDAASETGNSYAERAAPDRITKWQGSAKIENTNDARRWGQQTLEMKDAEGATLRKWDR